MTLTNSPPPDAAALDLLDRFARAPETLDADTAPLAVILAKQMNVESDSLKDAMAADAALKAACEVEERLLMPYISSMMRLALARGQLLDRLLAYMRTAAAKRVDTQYGFKATIRHTPAFEVPDPKLLPDGYVVRTPDTAAIRAALASGIEIRGVKVLPEKKTVVVS